MEVEGNEALYGNAPKRAGLSGGGEQQSYRRKNRRLEPWAGPKRYRFKWGGVRPSPEPRRHDGKVKGSEISLNKPRDVLIGRLDFFGSWEGGGGVR